MDNKSRGNDQEKKSILDDEYISPNGNNLHEITIKSKENNRETYGQERPDKSIEDSDKQRKIEKNENVNPKIE